MMLNSIGDITITGTQLVMSLGLLALAVGATILAIKYRLHKRSEQLLNHKNTENSSALERKKAGVDMEQHRRTFFWGGTAVAALTALLVMNWTTITEEVFLEVGSLEIPADMLVEPPITIPLPPPPPEPTPPPPPSTIIEIDDNIEEQQEMKDQTTEENTQSKETSTNPSPPMKFAPPPPPPPPPPPKPTQPQGPVIFAERMPHPMSCDANTEEERNVCRDQEMVNFIYSNIVYPTIAKEVGAEGMAVISFVIDTNGKMTNIEIARDPGSGLGQEAQRVVEKMGREMKWEPGHQQGHPVSVKFNIPVRFKLKG